MSADLAGNLERLRDGDLDFSKFIHRTHAAWESLGQDLMRRYKAPIAVGREDVIQEMLAVVPRFVAQWDPKRDVPLKSYVVYNAYDKAKKWLHKQRNAKRRDDKAPGRFERALTTLASDEMGDEILMSRASVEPSQQEGMERAEAIQALKSTDLVFNVYQQSGDVETTAGLLFGNPGARIAFRLDSLETARALVERSLESAAAVVAACTQP